MSWHGLPTVPLVRPQVSLRWSLLAISCVALLASACNKSSIKLYPVRGQVFYKNQPATGAQIVLQPQHPEAEPTDEAKACLLYTSPSPRDS